MKLAVIQCINGNYSVVAEGLTSEQSALVAFHNRCTILWNAPDVLTGEVAIVDEQLDVYQGRKEFITHIPPTPTPPPPEPDDDQDQEPEPEPEPEPEENNG